MNINDMKSIGYKIFAIAYTIIITFFMLAALLMDMLGYHLPENVIRDNLTLLGVEVVLFASIVAAWNFSHSSKYQWSVYANWFFLLLPWISLTIFFYA